VNFHHPVLEQNATSCVSRLFTYRLCLSSCKWCRYMLGLSFF
jgi:hypothetical protein